MRSWQADDLGDRAFAAHIDGGALVEEQIDDFDLDVRIIAPCNNQVST